MQGPFSFFAAKVAPLCAKSRQTEQKSFHKCKFCRGFIEVLPRLSRIPPRTNISRDISRDFTIFLFRKTKTG